MNTAEYNNAVANYADNLFRFVLKSTKDEAMAQDIVQDSFEKMWLNRSDVEASKAKSWLFTTGYRIMIDQIRRNSKQGDWEDHYENHSRTMQAQHDLKDILDDALSRLPEVQKQVILLRDYEGYDYKEIGDITGLSESQVKVYIFRGRKTLKQYLVSVEAIIGWNVYSTYQLSKPGFSIA